MRALFSFIGGRGHFLPLVPFARALAEAGHAVEFTGPPGMADVVVSAGFSPYLPVGQPSTGKRERLPLTEVDEEAEDRVLRDNFAGRAARAKAEALQAVFAAWRPDVVICDEVDFGAYVAAEEAGLPYASVITIGSGSFARKQLIAEPLHRLRAERGLPPDPQLHMLDRYLVLSPFPASFRHPEHPLPPTAQLVRLIKPPVGAPAAPWRTGDGPLVYFSLGTIFNTESGDLFARVIAGLSELPVRLVATVGPHIDPAELGAQPSNVHIAQFIAQEEILPYAGLVVTHGGSGSVLGALAHGVPMVVIPMGADQPP